MKKKTKKSAPVVNNTPDMDIKTLQVLARHKDI